MKKIANVLVTAIIFAGCSADRSEILKVYNWSAYIDEVLIERFEHWYEEQTGEAVHVIYQTFDVNETMLAKIERGQEDYDVVCPSEYIIERMLMNDLLLPIDRDFGNTPDYTANISPFIIDRFNQIEGFGKNANDYSVGYMWGTTGIIYNPKFVSKEETKSWDVLRNPKYRGKILMKDAFRDVYTALLIALNKEKIDSGEKTIEEVSFDASDESISLVENYLESFRDGIAGWEADFGKEQMVKEQAWINLSWSGDAEWAMSEALKSGVSLEYSVPETGSIVWFDGWVIPKYAQNIKAARYFINYLCMPENAIRNMDEIGYVSAVGGEEILKAKTDAESFLPIDVSYFFGEQACSACINPVQYPGKSIIDRCGVMHDSGDRTENLLGMWSRVKGDGATNWTFIILGITFVAASSYFAVKHRRKSYRSRTRR